MVEIVFGWSGIGHLFSSAGEPDLPLIQAITLVHSITFIGILLVVDALYRMIDPRSEPARP